MADAIDRLRSADSVNRAGFTDVILLGMGGSSLAPEVLRAPLTTPDIPASDDRLDRSGGNRSRLNRRRLTPSIFSPANWSKTSSTRSRRHFRRLLEAAGVPKVGRYFVAITDEGTGSPSARTENSAICLSTRPTSAAAIRRCRASSRRAHGTGPSARPDTAMLAAAEAPGEAALNPAVGLGRHQAAAQCRARQAVPWSDLPTGAVRAVGGAVDCREHGQAGLASSGSGGEPPGTAETYGADRLFAVLR